MRRIVGVALPDLFAFNPEVEKAEEREAVALLLGLIKDCDDATLQALTELLRAGLNLRKH